MEDFFKVVHSPRKKITFMGLVFDGHRGDAGARFAEQQFVSLFEKKAKRLDVKGAILSTCHEISRTMPVGTGTCISGIIMTNEGFYTVNAGDSRVVLVTCSGAQLLTHDHNLKNPDEFDRILEKGALINRGYLYCGGDSCVREGLDVTRSLGDVEFTRVGLLNEPEVVFYPLKNQIMHIVISCNGIYENMQISEIPDLVNNGVDPALRICGQAIKKGSGDNVTAIVVSFKF